MPDFLFGNASVAAKRLMRADRQLTRGLFTNNATGLSSRNRRDILNKTTIDGENRQGIIRRRLRFGWDLQDALTTAFTERR